MENNLYIQSSGKYPLSPITSDWMHEIMGNRTGVEKLVEKYGSPVNLHHIPSFKENIADFRKVFKRHEIEGKIYFARKANKSASLIKAAFDFGIGVDTASFKELEQCTALGGNAENLVLTAAVKTESLLKLAIRNSIPVIIDNYDELILAQNVAADMNIIANIGLRLSGFTVDGCKLYSRFGFDIDNDIKKLRAWFCTSLKFPNLLLTGFHFHLDSYSIKQRSAAIFQTLKIIKEFEATNRIKFLDIGGGILMNYLKSKTDWENFKTRLKQAVLSEEPPITFNNLGLGYEKNQMGNGVVGSLKTYPYYNETNGAQFLDELLTSKDESEKTVADRIIEHNVELRIEPGRSLLNLVGMTIARVVHRKKDANGNWLVGLDMNMSQLKSSSADFLLDPFMIYKNPAEEDNGIELYLTGAYCLEQDVILKRKLEFPKLPEVGDFVVFVNTGGYMMHFYETEAHLFDLSQNLYILTNEAREENIFSDETLLEFKYTLSGFERLPKIDHVSSYFANCLKYRLFRGFF